MISALGDDGLPVYGSLVGGSLETWEFPDLIEREKGADRLGVRDADKTKKKRRREAREISLLRRPQQI